MNNIEEFEGFQITIFEGERNTEKWGADYEDLAWCENTIAEIDAVEFMSLVLEAFEKFEDEEITEEEYMNELESICTKFVTLHQVA